MGGSKRGGNSSSINRGNKSNNFYSNAHQHQQNQHHHNPSAPGGGRSSRGDHSKRRNTVHSTVPDQSAPTTSSPSSSWAPVNPNYPLLQPAFLPFYAPLWHYAQVNGLHEHPFFQAAAAGLPPQPLTSSPLVPSLSTPAALSSPRPTNTLGGGRSRSPTADLAGRRPIRSPDLSGQRSHGSEKFEQRARGRDAGSNSAAIMTTQDRLDPAARGTAASTSSSSRPAFRRNQSTRSHHSSSVPSTPRRRTRALSYTSRSPSPSQSTNHSPRSAYSETNGNLVTPLGRMPRACPFETAFPKTRRRMPYSIGDEKLDKARAPLKKTIEAEEEKKLTGSMRELYDRLLPSSESEARRTKFAEKLEKLLNQQWPESHIKVRLFGSSGNMLCTSDSDVDICIETTRKELEKVCLLASALAKHGMKDVICVSSAKVPIVKFWDPELHLHCDMNVNNTLALENTRMIKTYVQIDERVRPLAMIVKHWTKRRILNDAAFGGTLSSYTWICLIIHFLQTRNPPILPALHQRPHRTRVMIDGVECSFADDVEALQDFSAANKESLGELLFGFFRHYAHDVDYETSVLSVKQGKFLSKEEKGWHMLQNNRLGVEEPFNVKRNLGNTADDTSFRGVHMELRRAFTLLSENINLESCCEQYEFPPEEERIWEKPAPQPRPVLARSSSQPGRGGRGGGGPGRFGRQGQHHHNNRGGNANRRSSGGAPFMGQQMNFFQQPFLGFNSIDRMRQTQQAQTQLQETLYQSYQCLQQQETELKLKLMQQQGQGGNNGSIQTPGSSEISDAKMNMSNYFASIASGQRHGAGPTSGYETPPNGPSSAPLRPEMFMYHPMYRSPYHGVQNGSNTNPSSPSLSPAMPELRRSLHRAQEQSDGASSHAGRSYSQSTNTPVRSQSQPARGMPLPPTPSWAAAAPSMVMLPGGQYVYQALPNAAKDAQVEDIGEEATSDQTQAQQYYGNFFASGNHQQQRQQQQHQMYTPVVPTFGDLTTSRQRDRPERLPPPTPRGGESRSPSPLQRSRTFPNASSSIQSDGAGESPLHQPPLLQMQESGQPLIMNGSTSGHPDARTLPHKTSLSESASLSDLNAYNVHQGYALPDPGHAHALASYGFDMGQPTAVSGDSEAEEGTDSPLSASRPVRTPPSTSSPRSPRDTSAKDRDEEVLRHHHRRSTSSPQTPAQRGWRRSIPISFGSIPPLEITPNVTQSQSQGTPLSAPSSSITESSQQQSAVSNSAAAHLSPVLETRTPSPTNHRDAPHFTRHSVAGIDPPLEAVKANGLRQQLIPAHMLNGQPPPKPQGPGEKEKEKEKEGGQTREDKQLSEDKENEDVNGWRVQHGHKKKQSGSRTKAKSLPDTNPGGAQRRDGDAEKVERKGG